MNAMTVHFVVDWEKDEMQDTRRRVAKCS